MFWVWVVASSLLGCSGWLQGCCYSVGSGCWGIDMMSWAIAGVCYGVIGGCYGTDMWLLDSCYGILNVY